MLPEKIDPDIADDAMADPAPTASTADAPELDPNNDVTASVDRAPASEEEVLAADVEEAFDSTAEAAGTDAADPVPATELAVAEPVEIRPAAPALDDPHHWEGPSIPFVPDHAIVEGMMALGFLTVILGLVALVPADLDARANPFLSPEGVKPEWYFMAPFELLHLVPPLPGMLVTGAAVGVLMLWPFIDRKPRRITRRPFMMALSFAILGVIVGLTVYSYIHAG